MGKFCQFLTQLAAHHMTVVGYLLSFQVFIGKIVQILRISLRLFRCTAHIQIIGAELHSAVSSASDSRSSCKFKSQHGHINSMKIDDELISVVSLCLLLIQEGQLSVTGEFVCVEVLVN